MGDRRLHRRFGTRVLFQSREPGRYVALTPLGVPLTRDGGHEALIERRHANRAAAAPAGWYLVGPPLWVPRHGGGTAREAAAWLIRTISEHDRHVDGLAPR